MYLVKIEKRLQCSTFLIFSSCIAQALRSLEVNLLLVKQLLVTSFVARILAHFVVYMCFAVVVYPSSV